MLVEEVDEVSLGVDAEGGDVEAGRGGGGGGSSWWWCCCCGCRRGGGSGGRRRRRSIGCRRRSSCRSSFSLSPSLSCRLCRPRPRHGRPLPHVVAHLRPQLQPDQQLPARRQRAQLRQEAAKAAADVGDGDSGRRLAARPRVGEGLFVQLLPVDVPRGVGEVGVEAVGERVGVGAGAVEALARVADGSLEGESLRVFFLEC